MSDLNSVQVTDVLKDCRQTRPKRDNKRPTRKFLKENILQKDEEILNDGPDDELTQKTIISDWKKDFLKNKLNVKEKPPVPPAALKAKLQQTPGWMKLLQEKRKSKLLLPTDDNQLQLETNHNTENSINVSKVENIAQNGESRKETSEKSDFPNALDVINPIEVKPKRTVKSKAPSPPKSKPEEMPFVPLSSETKLPINHSNDDLITPTSLSASQYEIDEQLKSDDYDTPVEIMARTVSVDLGSNSEPNELKDLIAVAINLESSRVETKKSNVDQILNTFLDKIENVEKTVKRNYDDIINNLSEIRQDINKAKIELQDQQEKFDGIMSRR